MSSERDLIDQVDAPATVGSLVRQLAAADVGRGDVVIVHTSMSALGWVAGGAQAVVEALLGSVGPSGTIVMPAHSGLSDPATWQNPPVPESWIPIIRAETPAFDRALTPTRGMGRIVEVFRHHPRTLRSDHPTLSFAANGPAAERIVSNHRLTPALGESSPLARLYELDAKVALIGVDHRNNTSLHLAEHRAEYPGKRTYREGSPVAIHGRRQWVEYDDLVLHEDDFAEIGDAFAATGAESRAPIGSGSGVVRISSQPALVDFAIEWMSTNRTAAGSAPESGGPADG